MSLDNFFMHDQCAQIGQLLKLLGDTVSIKSSPNAWIVNYKVLWLLFGQFLEKFGLLLNSASGYSVHN